jgi:hypothetical protein
MHKNSFFGLHCILRTFSNVLKKAGIFLLLLLCCGQAFAQSDKKFSLSGKVTDIATHESIPFASVMLQSRRSGILTDLNGLFTISNASNTDTLIISVVGYAGKRIPVSRIADKQHIVIHLEPQARDMQEIVVSSRDNPANRIIKKVLDNKRINNWERITAFRYTAYNRFHATMANKDTLKEPVPDAPESSDTVRNKSHVKVDVSIGADSNSTKSLDSLVAKQHLFLVESVEDINYKYPDNYKKIIEASKVSGTGDPTLSLIAGEYNTFNIYKDMIEVGGKPYLSPIAYSALNKYNYHIEDTLYTSEGDSVFVISYSPKKEKLFNPFRGLLYVNTGQYAVQNIIAKPVSDAGEMTVVIRQQFEYVNHEHWFPVQVNTDYLVPSGSNAKREFVCIGKSYAKDITFNPDFEKRTFNNVDIDIDKNATKRNDVYWQQERHDSLSEKDKETYKIIDSVGKSLHFDRKMAFMRAAATGKLRVKYFDFDLDKILGVNLYEKYRIGLGAHTNETVSPYYNVGGYFAYGIRDQQWKYRGELNLTPIRNSFFQLSGWYVKDVSEFGGYKWELKGRNTDVYRALNMADMYNYKGWGSSVSWMMLKYLQTKVSYTQYNKYLFENLLTRPYYYQGDGLDGQTRFPYTEVKAAFRYAYKEKWMREMGMNYNMGTTHPILNLDITKGLSINGGRFDYLRADFRLDAYKKIKLAGTFSYQLRAGKVWGDVPLFDQYSAFGGRNASSIYVYSPNTFLTMRTNEFSADRYAALFLTHSFEKYLIKRKKFQPVLELHHNMMIGGFSNPALHDYPGMKVIDKLYLESGISINNIVRSGYSGFGVAAMYRYGYYSLPDFKDNIALMLTLWSPFLK